MLASGAGKAYAIERMLQGPVDPHLPASILQLHQNVMLIADQAALSLLD
jgi:glucosamine-6-phosphate deaminase